MWNDIKIKWVPIEDNVADPLTKALPQQKHDSHVVSLDIRYRMIGSSASERLLVYSLDPIGLDAFFIHITLWMQIKFY